MSIIETWHRRLGHVSKRGMVQLCKQDLLCGDEVKKLNLSEHYVYDKACTAKFGYDRQRTKGTLDFDIC